MRLKSKIKKHSKKSEKSEKRKNFIKPKISSKFEDKTQFMKILSIEKRKFLSFSQYKNEESFKDNSPIKNIFFDFQNSIKISKRFNFYINIFKP